MSQIKKLAGQTFWYGGSNVVAKLLNALMTPLLTYLMIDKAGMEAFGIVSLIYVYFGVMNVVFTYGMETGYFRFSNKKEMDSTEIFRTTFGSLIISTLLFCGILYALRVPIEKAINLGGHPEYITLCIFILAFDTLVAIPFAKLRQNNRPKRYAFTKIVGIFINMFMIICLLAILPSWAKRFDSIAHLYQRFDKVTLILFANLVASFCVFLLLIKEWSSFRFSRNITLWKEMIRYSSPMIIIGMAGMINEVMDRQFLNYWYPGTDEDKRIIVGIYSANYKISIIITMFIQAFKMAAEPFFFSKGKDSNAKPLFAKVMKWFVITLCIAFLTTALFLDYWKYYVSSSYRVGLFVVPILLFANICSGLYYNLSVWYKLTDKMQYGIYITVFGALITVMGNYFFIPQYGMLASAWTTCICYASMVVVCYILGQKFFPVPYKIKTLLGYLCIMMTAFFSQEIIKNLTDNIWIRTTTGILLFMLFILYTLWQERSELKIIELKNKLKRRVVK